MPSWESLSGKELLEALQTECASKGISDVHCSPERSEVRIDMRLHGILEFLCRIRKETYVDFVRTVKFASHLKLNIDRLPQDGQFTFTAGSRTVNVRVATLPTRFGERITLRILDPAKGIVPLEKLGFPKTIADTLKDLAQSPGGLILVTGPTGSGKTTTLYALISTIIGTHRNIMTIEDPIEYEIPAIVQSQVDADKGFGFATALRSALRHDPDVILVGEIRDFETAQAAVDAALTGHLVLSTLHTNSAVEAVTRLLSMGISPYTFAPSLKGIVAQRLVRTLTDACRASGTCDPSQSSSYGGQTAVGELLLKTPEIESLIHEGQTGSIILQKAKEQGFTTMRECGEELVKRGETTRTEIERVTEE